MRRHIHDVHGHILPSRINSDKENKEALLITNKQSKESKLVFKLGCPCCLKWVRTITRSNKKVWLVEFFKKFVSIAHSTNPSQTTQLFFKY
jgi:hypothetical protein